jgi:VanZ family protein
MTNAERVAVGLLTGAIALATASAAVRRAVPRFADDAPERVANGALTALDGWTSAAAGGEVHAGPDGAALSIGSATPDDDEHDARLWQAVGGPGVYLVGATMRAPALDEDAVAGLSLYALNGDGELIPESAHDVVELDAPDATWRRYERTLASDDRAIAKVAVIAEISGSSGTLEVRDVSVRRTDETAAWRAARIGLVLGWLGVIVGGVLLLAPRLPRKPVGIAIPGLVAAILLGTLAPAVVNTRIVSQTYRAVDAATAVHDAPRGFRALKYTVLADLISVKTAHFGMFWLLGIAAATAFPRHRGRAAIGLVAFGGLTEALQMLRIDRTPSIDDVAIDAAGALAGVALVTAWSWARPGARSPDPSPGPGTTPPSAR